MAEQVVIEQKTPHPRRAAAATLAVGTGLVATGAELRNSGTKAAERATHKHRFATLAHLKTSKGVGRWGAGSVLGLAGATGMGVGAHDLTRKKKIIKDAGSNTRDFVRQGIEGNRDALREKVNNSTSPAPAKVRAKAIGTGLAAGAVGSLATHRIIDRRVLLRGAKRVAAGRHPGSSEFVGRHAIAAVAGTSAGIATLPVASRMAHKDGYEITPTGVKRRKTPPVRPTRSKVVETRPDRTGRRGYSNGPVVKLDSTTYPGSKLSPNQKRARVMAAGATPVVGQLAAAAQAARTAPPDQKKSAAALQFGGSVGGATAGAVVGSQAAARAAERSPKLNAKLVGVERKTSAAKVKVASKVPGRAGRAAQAYVHPNKKPGPVLSRMIAASERGKVAGKIVRPLVKRPSAAIVGGLAGKAIGGFGGGFAGYSEALHREKTRNEKLSKLAVPPPEPTKREQRDQLKRKRRNLGLGVAATTAGAGGVGLLAARELGPKLPRIGHRVAPHVPKLERAALGTAIIGGGIGSLQGVNSARIQHRDLADQERQLGVKKAFGVPRVPTFRASNIAMRRSKMGTMIPVRRANGISKAKSDLPMPGISEEQFRERYNTPGEHMIPAKDLQSVTRYPILPQHPSSYHDLARSIHRDGQKEPLFVSYGRKNHPVKPLADIPTLVEGHHRAHVMAAGNKTARVIVARKPGPLVPRFVRNAGKVAKIDTTMNNDQAAKLVAQHGSRGPLPKTMDRNTRMKAYEARYVHAGGPKGEKWKHRADTADHVTGAGIALGAAAGATELTAKHPKVTALLVRHNKSAEKIAHRAGRLGVAAGTGAAASELFHRHAQHRQASYSHSPAGVAASALRRMRDNTPDGK